MRTIVIPVTFPLDVHHSVNMWQTNVRDIYRAFVSRSWAFSSSFIIERFNLSICSFKISVSCSLYIIIIMLWVTIMIKMYYFICPIAIAYSMGQIIKSVCVCQSVCLAAALSRSHFLIDFQFTKIGTDVRTPKRKNEFVRGSISHHPFSYFVPPNPHFRPRGPEHPRKY